MKSVHPYCQVCGWRKGGRDSWNGRTCKCGLAAPAMKWVTEQQQQIEDERERQAIDEALHGRDDYGFR